MAVGKWFWMQAQMSLLRRVTAASCRIIEEPWTVDSGRRAIAGVRQTLCGVLDEVWRVIIGEYP
jgi:hypothetical protein